MVIVKAEFAIGRPDIRRLPIINGISIEKCHCLSSRSSGNCGTSDTSGSDECCASG